MGELQVTGGSSIQVARAIGERRLEKSEGARSDSGNTIEEPRLEMCT